MLKGIERLYAQKDLMDLFIRDASTETVSIGRRLPLTCRDCIRAIMGEKLERVSQTLEYKNGPLRMSVDKILSRKRRKNEDWGETVDIALNIRYALFSGRSGKITTPEQLLATLGELYGTEEETETINITN